MVEQKKNEFRFKVNEVKLEAGNLNVFTPDRVLSDLISCSKYEDFSHRGIKEKKMVYQELSGLIGTIHKAFSNHYALKLTVSDIIIAIGQGIGHHINENSDKLRKYFVKHESKEMIRVIRDNYSFGQQNDWSDIFEDFTKEIQKRVPEDFCKIIIDDSSIATPTSKIASQINLMNSLKSYFKYECFTLCGIPEIILVGAEEDWKGLLEKMTKLIKINNEDCLEINWWLEHLVFVVENICYTALEKKASVDFWNSIFKYETKSGGSYVTGWCNVFCPYALDKDGKLDRNGNVNWRQKTWGLLEEKVPKFISEVPFIWSFCGTEYEMKFHSGFLGGHYNEVDNCLETVLFWSVTMKDSILQKKHLSKFEKLMASFEDVDFDLEV